MFDLPPQDMDKPKYEFHEFILDKFEEVDLKLEYASQIKAEFSDDVQWGDIPKIIKRAIELAGGIFDVREKRDAVVQIVDSIIDDVYKAMVHPFIDLSFKLLEPKVSLEDIASNKDALEFACKIRHTFEDKFEWEDLASVVLYASKFSEDKECALEIINNVINNASLPNTYNDQIFKEFLLAFLNEIPL